MVGSRLIETILADLTASTEIGKLVIFGFIGGLGILALAGTKYDCRNKI
jgi:hypothetical protein